MVNGLNIENEEMYINTIIHLQNKLYDVEDTNKQNIQKINILNRLLNAKRLSKRLNENLQESIIDKLRKKNIENSIIINLLLLFILLSIPLFYLL
jgi:hypothetical protein